MSTPFKFGVPISKPAKQLRPGDTLVELGSEGEYVEIETIDRTYPGWTYVWVTTPILIPKRAYKFRNDDNVLLVNFPLESNDNLHNPQRRDKTKDNYRG